MATKAPAKPGPRSGKGGKIPGWLELLVLLVVALLLSVFIKTFFVQMFFVPSESMEPLFVEDDRILVQKISYWRGEVERGDVVVFQDPGGWLGRQAPLSPVQKVLSTMGLYPSGGHLVKRVIAVGGDRVRCCDAQDRVTVNGVPLNERRYLKKGVSPSERTFDITVPQDRLWVMGDNRSNSEDSRFHPQLRGRGTIPVENVVGKVWGVVWPLSRFEVIGHPDTFDRRALVDSGRDAAGDR